MTNATGIVDGHGHAPCSTFNIWDLTGTGIVTKQLNNDTKDNWTVAGGCGSGVPIIAGLIRPEEVELAASSAGDGKIHHALAFSFDQNRCGPPMYPFAYRNDGIYAVNNHPAEGMLFQLDPLATEADFNAWGLNVYGKILARTLQTYGAVLVDNGENGMAFQIQRLVPGDPLDCADTSSNCYAWESRIPGFIESIYNIPAVKLRVVDTAYLGAALLSDNDAHQCSR